MGDFRVIKILKSTRHRLLKLIGQQKSEKIITFSAKWLGVDLLSAAYHQRGILKYGNHDVSGESHVINTILNSYFSDQEIVIFDVGANIGNYTKELKQAFPKSKIYAFEPNHNAFQTLEQELNDTDIERFCVGLSSHVSSKKGYTYASDDKSEHASVYKEVLTDLHQAKEIIEIVFETISLDCFCEQHEIKEIDFLKIDTEGHELEVLSGGKEMITQGNIKIIQFEFNEMNIVSRVFLKDFYQILSDYDIYRLDSNRLIPLADYNSENEIFKFQNFLAIRKSVQKYLETSSISN
ncbi:MAG: FkbM family methyltransferase [Cyanobacteria bacterium J06649_11]